MTASPFDIVDLVARTYRQLYQERAYLLRLAAGPLAIIFTNFVVVSLVFPDISVLRRGLLLMPAMLAEAWLVAQFLRTLLTGERWPIRLSRTDLDKNTLPPALFRRARGLLSAILAYFLTTLCINALAGVMTVFIMTHKPDESGAPLSLTPENNALAFGLSTLVVVALFNFRLLWLYIPLAVNMPLTIFLRKTRGALINFQLIGLWLAVSFPLMAVGMVLLQPVLSLSQGDGVLAFAFFLLFSFFNVLLQTAMALATSVAMALMFSQLFLSDKPAP